MGFRFVVMDWTACCWLWVLHHGFHAQGKCVMSGDKFSNPKTTQMVHAVLGSWVSARERSPFCSISLELRRVLTFMGGNISIQSWDCPMKCKDHSSAQTESLVGNTSIVGVHRWGYEHLVLGVPLRVSTYVGEHSLHLTGMATTRWLDKLRATDHDQSTHSRLHQQNWLNV